jgi:hypothetical protein
MILPKSVLESAAGSTASATAGVAGKAAALVLARARALPRVCADGPAVFCAVVGVLPPLADWLSPLAALPAAGAPPELVELASPSWLAALCAFASSVTFPGAAAGVRA